MTTEPLNLHEAVEALHAAAARLNMRVESLVLKPIPVDPDPERAPEWRPTWARPDAPRGKHVTPHGGHGEPVPLRDSRL